MLTACRLAVSAMYPLKAVRTWEHFRAQRRLDQVLIAGCAVLGIVAAIRM